jgi:hypothetical protein
MKYFDTHYHAVRERVEAGSLYVAWVPSHEQLAGCPNKFNTWARTGFTAISQLGYAEGYKQGSMDIVCFIAIFFPIQVVFSWSQIFPDLDYFGGAVVRGSVITIHAC